LRQREREGEDQRILSELGDQGVVSVAVSAVDFVASVVPPIRSPSAG
jgi:hypothetical protein